MVKIGRTHLEDAVPLTVGQEWSGWASSIAHDADRRGRSLREAALDCGAISAEDFDRIVNPANMVGPY